MDPVTIATLALGAIKLGKEISGLYQDFYAGKADLAAADAAEVLVISEDILANHCQVHPDDTKALDILKRVRQAKGVVASHPGLTELLFQQVIGLYEQLRAHAEDKVTAERHKHFSTEYRAGGGLRADALKAVALCLLLGFSGLACTNTHGVSVRLDRSLQPPVLTIVLPEGVTSETVRIFPDTRPGERFGIATSVKD